MSDHGILRSHLARRTEGTAYQNQAEIDLLRSSLEGRTDFHYLGPGSCVPDRPSRGRNVKRKRRKVPSIPPLFPIRCEEYDNGFLKELADELLRSEGMAFRDVSTPASDGTFDILLDDGEPTDLHINDFALLDDGWPSDLKRIDFSDSGKGVFKARGGPP